MKKERFTKTLNLNKETVTNLLDEEMRRSRAGGDKTDIGASCDTGLPCCNTVTVACNCVP